MCMYTGARGRWGTDEMMQGKVALVTGGAAGIGRAIVEKMVTRGVKVVICDVDVRQGENFAKEMNSKHGKKSALFSRCDVTDRNSFKESFEKAKSHLGTPNILINNAGILDDSPKGWERQVDINFKGAVNGSMLALEYMGWKNGGRGGTVLNTSSILAMVPTPAFPIYCATKAGVLFFTRCFGEDFHYNLNRVKFIAFCPGLTGGSAIFDKLESSFPIPGPEMVDMFQSVVGKKDFQSIDSVADAALEVLEKGKNGSVWTAVLDQPAEEYFPVDAKLVLHGPQAG